MGLKELFLNKGWAGKTLSRQETIERINPLIRRHYELNHSYEYAIDHLGDADAVERMNEHQRAARTDIGKLSETVLSAGGVSYNGTDLEQENFDLGKEDGEILRRLQDLESEFEQLLSEELKLEHQIRTRAVLNAVLANGRARQEFLREILRTLPRTATAR